MNQLNIGSIGLPVNAATKTFAILAKRGAGKTYTGGVMAEEFYKAGIPFVVFDPIDVWWGLRLAANGKDAGLPVVVFGLRNADIQLTRNMGRDIARAIVRDNISCIISTFGMSKTDMRHLIAEFSEELLHINNTPRHVFIEEAHEYVPQRIQPGMGKTFAAVEALVTMGRNQGIGVTMLNQRAATINKDVLTQLDTLLAFQNTSPQDRKALHEWVEAQSAEGDFDKFMASLPSLPKGKGWIWSPEFMGVFERIEVRKRETFHPDREKIGSQFVMPELTQGDIQSFISNFKVSEPVSAKPSKASDRPAPAASAQPDTREIEIRLRNEYESKIIEKDAEIRRLSTIVRNVQNAVGAPAAASGPATQILSGAVELWKTKLGKGLATRLLTFFAENPTMEFTKPQVCLALGISPTAGHTSNEFGKLMRTNTVVRNDGLYRLNPNL